MRNVLQSYLQQTQAQKAESMRLPPPPSPITSGGDKPKGTCAVLKERESISAAAFVSESRCVEKRSHGP